MSCFFPQCPFGTSRFCLCHSNLNFYCTKHMDQHELAIQNHKAYHYLSKSQALVAFFVNSTADIKRKIVEKTDSAIKKLTLHCASSLGIIRNFETRFTQMILAEDLGVDDFGKDLKNATENSYYYYKDLIGEMQMGFQRVYNLIAEWKVGLEGNTRYEERTISLTSFVTKETVNKDNLSSARGKYRVFWVGENNEKNELDPSQQAAINKDIGIGKKIIMLYSKDAILATIDIAEKTIKFLQNQSYKKTYTLLLEEN